MLIITKKGVDDNIPPKKVNATIFNKKDKLQAIRDCLDIRWLWDQFNQLWLKLKSRMLEKIILRKSVYLYG